MYGRMALAGYPKKLTFQTLLRPSSTGMFSSRGAVLKCSSTSLAPTMLLDRVLSSARVEFRDYGSTKNTIFSSDISAICRNATRNN